MTSSTQPAIIRIVAIHKNNSKINYSRRMYAIMRRYTPQVIQGKDSECFADLTGLRTFFKMSYREMTQKIMIDLESEIGITFIVKASTLEAFNNAKNNTKKSRSISTFKEMNKLFAGFSFVSAKHRKSLVLRRKLTVPFLGKVA